MDACMHGNICDSHDVDKLKQRLTYVWHGLDKVTSMTQRNMACVHVKGRGHFEHSICFKSTHEVLFRSKSTLLSYIH